MRHGDAEAGLSIRIFAFDEADQLCRIGQEFYDDLRRGDGAMPTLKNQTIRVAYVLINTVGGQLVDIRRISGHRWSMNTQGQIDKKTKAALREETRDLLEQRKGGAKPKIDGSIIDLSDVFRERNITNRLTWEPTDREITRIVNDLWPETSGVQTSSARYLKSPERKPRPLTRAAERAFKEFWEPVWNIRRQIDCLGPRDLESLADKLSQELDDPFGIIENKVHAGILDAVKYEIARQKAWKRNKGTWFAVCEISTSDDEPIPAYRMHTAKVVECKSKKEAEKAARDLLKEYADRFSELSDVSAYGTD